MLPVQTSEQRPFAPQVPVNRAWLRRSTQHLFNCLIPYYFSKGTGLMACSRSNLSRTVFSLTRVPRTDLVPLRGKATEAGGCLGCVFYSLGAAGGEPLMRVGTKVEAYVA